MQNEMRRFGLGEALRRMKCGGLGLGRRCAECMVGFLAWGGVAQNAMRGFWLGLQNLLP